MAGEEARKTRAESRARRRQDGASSSPAEAVENETSQEDDDSLGAVKQAAKVAAVGAAVGAATAAARALTHQERGEDEQQEPASAAEEPVAEEPQGDREEPRDEREEPRDEGRKGPEREEPEQEKPDREEFQEPIRGAGPDETQAVVREAREQLQSLLGKPAESVSSLERTQNGWLISFEVLELSRVPETTDVLASYEVELDDSRGLRRYARVRRYARSQAEGDDR